MNILLLGAAGFIGTNLTLKLVEHDCSLTLVDGKKEYFSQLPECVRKKVKIIESTSDVDTDFEKLLQEQNVVYHLISTTVPTTSNQLIATELIANVVMTAKMLDACVKTGVQKVVFISSGGTVYGKEGACPLKEDTLTNPISSYGIQKITIEKLLYLYNYLHGLDYRIVRLANPYGPYQRPNGVLGAITTFTYKAINGDEIIVYGDGTVVRDFIYIDDAIRAIVNIAEGESEHKTFNVGCGYGTSIREVLEAIEKALGVEMNVRYVEGRKVDVPVNYLDISRYEQVYGEITRVSLQDGVVRTAEFLKRY